MGEQNVLGQDVPHDRSSNVPAREGKPYYAESRARSLVKALSWRITAFTVTTIVTLVITRSWEFAAVVGVIDTLIKIVLYYGHERLWNRSTFGR